jgi:hypothetical protein
MRERERREHPSSSGIQKRDDEGRRKKWTAHKLIRPSIKIQ